MPAPQPLGLGTYPILQELLHCNVMSSSPVNPSLIPIISSSLVPQSPIFWSSDAARYYARSACLLTAQIPAEIPAVVVALIATLTPRLQAAPVSPRAHHVPLDSVVQRMVRNGTCAAGFASIVSSDICPLSINHATMRNPLFLQRLSEPYNTSSQPAKLVSW